MSHILRNDSFIFKVGGNIFKVNDKFAFTNDYLTVTNGGIDVKIDYEGRRMFFLDLNAGVLSVLNLDTYSLITTISDLSSPWAISLDIAHNKIFVSSDAGMYVINATNYSIINTISTFSTAGIAVDVANNRIFLAASGSSTVHIYDYSSYELITSFTVGSGGNTGLLIDTQNNRLLSCCGTGIYAVALSDLTLIGSIAPRGGQRMMALCYGLNELYSSCSTNGVCVYNLNTLTLLQIIPTVFTANEGLDYNRETNQLVCTSYTNTKLQILTKVLF